MTESLSQNNMPRTLRILAAALLATVTAGLASTAWTREGAAIDNYSCRNGERFAVEHHTNHIRLRTGAGIFALTSVPASRGDKYSDGQTVFWDNGTDAILERAGLPAANGCMREATRS